MTIEDVINKAITGGYHVYPPDGEETYYDGSNNTWSVWTRKDNHSSFVVLVHETLMDRAFWQALGRVLGWQQICLSCGCETLPNARGQCDSCLDTVREVPQRFQEAWLYHWHRLIDHLAIGNTIHSFFEGFSEECTSHSLSQGPSGTTSRCR